MGLLQDKKILITRDEHQAYNFMRLIRQEGGLPIVFPTVSITAPSSWAEVDRAILNLDQYNWIVFSSSNAVRFFFKRTNGKPLPGTMKIAVVGKRTAATLKKMGVHADLVPRQSGANGLLAELSKMDINGHHFLLPASEITLATLKTGIEALGGNADVVTTYRTVQAESQNQGIIETMIEFGTLDCITFFSPSAVRNFKQLLSADSLRRLKSNTIMLAAIGKTTAQAIEREGLTTTVVAHSPNEEEFLAAIGERFDMVKSRKELVS